MVGRERGYQLVADLFWGGKAVNGQVVVALKPCQTEAKHDIIEHLADLYDNSVDRSEDQAGALN